MTIPDPRHIGNGCEIPTERYADQPYIVRTDDGAWLCVLTTSGSVEGASGQHIISMRSTDRGTTWSAPVDVEPADGPEASYAVLLKTPYGRIYAFYTHNTDRVAAVKTEDGGVFTRVDSLGHYVFKYSDDGGRSWSAERYDVPVRAFACDRENVYGGALRFFWNVGRPLILGDAVYLVLHKVGAMGAGFFAQSEGAFMRSDNLLTERDPARIRFATLPDGEIGLRAPAGGFRVAEEQSLSALSDGTLFCVYRTIAGWPACAYSRDGGHTWTEPAFLTYAPAGGRGDHDVAASLRRVKHPRAANFAWRCPNGMFLYWFHNHGGAFIQANHDWLPYEDRNPAWLMAGREVETPAGRMLAWSQPEILLYDDDPYVRMSYPDLVVEDDRYYLTETQKHTARVHAIAPALLDGLFGQWENRTVAREGLLLEVDGPADTAPMPALPRFLERDYASPTHGARDVRAGFSLDLWLELPALAPGQALLDTRAPWGQGLCLRTAEAGAAELLLNDGRQECRWAGDPGLLTAGARHHLVVTVDGGPKIITVVIDGLLNDGGAARQFGWGRFSPTLREANGGDTLHLAPAVRHLRVYGRALRTSEAVGNWRAGLSSPEDGDR
ncbi:MAG TPA: exo-alpha-sialidase [Armatimonadota bacterium]|nr:exo-alpha-sialidase [Armatimonadota bacterium]HOS43250.1 exo-alpha-sialidase [Armatimonadota bacterium]